MRWRRGGRICWGASSSRFRSIAAAKCRKAKRPSTRRRYSTSMPATSRCCIPGCISIRRSLSRGAAALARRHRGARDVWRSRERPRIAARHEFHAGRHPVSPQPYDPARPLGLRGLARNRAQAASVAPVAGAARRPPAAAGLQRMLRQPHDRRPRRDHLQGNPSARAAPAGLSRWPRHKVCCGRLIRARRRIWRRRPLVHLAWFIGRGCSVHGWNQPWSSLVGSDWMNPDIYLDLVRSLDRAGFDYVVVDDGSFVPDAFRGSSEWYLRNASTVPKSDPMPLVPRLAQASPRLGIVATMTIAFYPPFLAARLGATLDHLTHGRVGLNLVTAHNDRTAQNFGLERHHEHDLRYEMADEWMEVVNRRSE